MFVSAFDCAVKSEHAWPLVRPIVKWSGPTTCCLQAAGWHLYGWQTVVMAQRSLVNAVAADGLAAKAHSTSGLQDFVRAMQRLADGYLTSRSELVLSYE